MLTGENLREYCLSLGNVEEKMPFGKFARRYDTTLVFYVKGHMFCMFDINDFTSVNLRSCPEEIDSLMASYDAVTQARANMRLWINIQLGGDISNQHLRQLINRAYDIILAKYS